MGRLFNKEKTDRLRSLFDEALAVSEIRCEGWQREYDKRVALEARIKVIDKYALQAGGQYWADKFKDLASDNAQLIARRDRVIEDLEVANHHLRLGEKFWREEAQVKGTLLKTPLITGAEYRETNLRAQRDSLKAQNDHSLQSIGCLNKNNDYLRAQRDDLEVENKALSQQVIDISKKLAKADDKLAQINYASRKPIEIGYYTTQEALKQSYKG